ncbi:MAG: CheR family methyltransferase [Nannocystaceae bacterium]|nr:hypothetical protein [bacterium]
MDVSAPHETIERVFVLVASAGGHEAIADVLGGIGRNSRHAFIVALKASDGPSMLEETLGFRTGLRIVEVDSAMSIRPGTVYIAPPGSDLVASDASSVAPQPRAMGVDPIERVLASVARSWGGRATVVVLSGGPASVQAGARAVLAAGGAVYCQSPSTAALQDMPASVLREVGATSVGSPAEIGGWIRDGLSADVRDTGDPELQDMPLPPGFWTLLERVRTATNLDLYAYRTATLFRRVMQRARALGCRSLEDYFARALADDREIRAMGSRLLIGTTDFFRNEPLFEDLRDVVVPRMRYEPSVAVWCAGCSTGEEAYSVAAALIIELEALGSSARVRVMATDVRPEAIAHASAGRYSAERVANVPRALRERFGRSKDGQWHVGDQLRDAVSFSCHDVLCDPPPRDRDLVLFRNVMIYLRPEVHPFALRRMHEALRPGGFLAVGESESTHSLDGAFARDALRGGILQRVE